MEAEALGTGIGSHTVAEHAQEAGVLNLASVNSVPPGLRVSTLSWTVLNLSIPTGRVEKRRLFRVVKNVFGEVRSTSSSTIEI